MEIRVEPRDYQKNILKTSLDNNTLVVLPTGLGKTLIALLLSIHRLKQFPSSKVLFLAPTRPLVDQHMQTYKKQLPELFADLQLFTGSVPAKERRKIFQTADVIFSTPQCIANDIRAGLYNLEEVSLLIIDEAHRCLKNYDYTHVVENYKNQAKNQRILGLTASPGSDKDKVLEICKHLDINEIELRTRESDDVKNYLQERDYQMHEVPFPQEFIEIKVLLKRLFDSAVNELRSRDMLLGPVNKITLLKLQNQLAMRAANNDYTAMHAMSHTAKAIKISHAMELLETQTLSGVLEYLKSLQKQAQENKSRAVKSLVKERDFNAALISLNELITKKIEHPKIEEAAAIIENEIKQNPLAKTIVFTQFRETAIKLTQRFNQIKNINAAIFVGQAKKQNSGLSQKEQQAVINQFKEGKLNVLAATSIGEEGLDIPEVSAVIFYEPIPSAIRKIQRAGRTARLSPGKLIILMTKDTRDVTHHYAAGAREKKMYRVIEQVKKDLHEKNKNPSINKFL